MMTINTRSFANTEFVYPPIRDVDYLKRSLEQIAASRERNPREGDWIKDLSPKELELIGEILKQYLA